MGVMKTSPGALNEVLITQANGTKKVMPKKIKTRCSKRCPICLCLLLDLKNPTAGALLLTVACPFIINPTIGHLELDGGKKHNNQKQHPGQRCGIAHPEEFKAIAIDIKDDEQG